MNWLPSGFVHPARLDVPGGCHLRPIRAADADLEYPAVMGSRQRLWSIACVAWGCPPESMTFEKDLADVERHEAETALLGCVYIDPPEIQGSDAEISRAGHGRPGRHQPGTRA